MEFSPILRTPPSEKIQRCLSVYRQIKLQIDRLIVFYFLHPIERLWGNITSIYLDLKSLLLTVQIYTSTIISCLSFWDHKFIELT